MVICPICNVRTHWNKCHICNNDLWTNGNDITFAEFNFSFDGGKRKRSPKTFRDGFSINISKDSLYIWKIYERRADLLLKLPRENNISIDDQINNLLPRLLSLFLFLWPLFFFMRLNLFGGAKCPILSNINRLESSIH